jgi:GNAT superfamily N-acetyltransferase
VSAKPDASKPGRTVTPPVSVLDAKGRRDAFYLARQWHHYFGAEYEPDWLPNPPAALAGVSDADGQYGAVAHHGLVRVGGALASVVSGDHAESDIGPTPIDERALAGDGAIYIYLLAVDLAWRGRGLGSQLLGQVLDWARDETAAETVVAQSWQRREHASSAPLFETAGFERIVRLPDYYAETGRSACPDCGIWLGDDIECSCGAVLYAKDIERTEPQQENSE